MYHATLTNRYLTSRVIPLIAVAAVALCVALVIIVVSVMTGFLDMVRSAGRTLMGDVVVAYPVSGIPYYDDLIERIEARPEAEAATAVVDSWGLLRMPYPMGDRKEIETVQIWGVDESFSRVTDYDETIQWREVPEPLRHWLFTDAVARTWQDLDVSLSDDQWLRILRTVSDRIDPGRFDEIDEAERRRQIAALAPGARELYLRELSSFPDDLRAILTDAQWEALLESDPRLADPQRIYGDALAMRDPVTGEEGIVLGLHVSVANQRMRDGTVMPSPRQSGYWFMPRFDVTLTTIPIDAGGGFVEPESFILPVVNEFRSGVFLIDDKRVLIPLERAQRMLNLEEAVRLDADGETEIGIDPARATLVLVRAADGVTPDTLRGVVAEAYRAFVADVEADPDLLVSRMPQEGFGLSILTWEQQQAQFIGPIEKERELMRTLFSLVYLVCAGLVLSIFWAIVYEKTRDIGILRSVGASRSGISWIFLRYGLVVGVLGAALGLLLAYLVVHNINTIHDAMGDPPLWLGVGLLAAATIGALLTVVRSLSGRLLPLVLGVLVTSTLALAGALVLLLRKWGGFEVWNPEIYYFTEIPNQMDMGSAVITMVGAVIFSLIGAFIPAAKAADTNPVEALRYE